MRIVLPLTVTLLAVRSCVLKHLSPDPAVFPGCNAAMGGAKLIIAKHVACHLNKHSPDSRKENMLSLLAGLETEYCCTLLPHIRLEGKVLSSHIAFCAHVTKLQMYRWRDVIAGSSAPILPIRNYFAKINTK